MRKMKIKIKVTKDVLRRSMWCNKMPAESCAIALAIRDIFPNASVEYMYIKTGFGNIQVDNKDFIESFDTLKDTPELRLDLPEYEFEITLPAEVVEAINIDDIYRSETLEVVAL